MRVEWLVMRGAGSGVTEGAVRVDVTDSGFNGPVEVANNIMVNLGNSGVVIGSTESQSVVVDVANNVIAPNNATFQAIRLAPVANTFNPGSDVYVVNNTAYGTAASGIVSLAAANSAVTLHNDIAWGFGTCYNVASPALESNYNLSSDGSAPGANSLLNVPATGVGGANFTDRDGARLPQLPPPLDERRARRGGNPGVAPRARHGRPEATGRDVLGHRGGRVRDANRGEPDVVRGGAWRRLRRAGVADGLRAVEPRLPRVPRPLGGRPRGRG